MQILYTPLPQSYGHVFVLTSNKIGIGEYNPLDMPTKWVVIDLSKKYYKYYKFLPEKYGSSSNFYGHIIISYTKQLC